MTTFQASIPSPPPLTHPSLKPSPMNPPAYSKATPSPSPIHTPYHLPKLSDPTPSFASLSLHNSDTLRLLHFPIPDISFLTTILTMHWTPGIQSTRLHGPAHEFKLRGNPWSGLGDDAITSRILVRELLKGLWESGWRLCLSGGSGGARRGGERDMLVFRFEGDEDADDDDGERNMEFRERQGEMQWTILSFIRGDRIRLLGASEETHKIKTTISELLRNLSWLKKGEWMVKKWEGEAWEWKLRGWPWMAAAAGGEESMRVRGLLLGLMELLDRDGWRLYADVDLCGDGGELSTWFCVRGRGG